MNNLMHFTGTQVNYYFHCQRQLWLFSHNITCEHESEIVYLGKLIHETSYERERKEIEIDHLKLDFFNLQANILHEVKKSQSFHQGHEWQVLFYLFYLKQKGITNITGQLDYPKIRKTKQINLTEVKEKHLIDILMDIKRIVEMPEPPSHLSKLAVCRRCSYYELCMC